jgi:heme-degrading monooxygenase HmoA
VIQVLWEYVVRPEKIVEFETNYATSGAWAMLFQKSPAYRGTILLRDAGGSRRYLTIDIWRDRESLEAFRSDHAQEYGALDRRCEAFTESEREVGIFDVV